MVRQARGNAAGRSSPGIWPRAWHGRQLNRAVVDRIDRHGRRSQAQGTQAQGRCRRFRNRGFRAELGDDESIAAMYMVGQGYHEGIGVEQDAAQAWAWWEKAAELGVGAQTTPDIQLYSSLLIRHLLPSHNSTRKPSSIWE